MKRPGPAIPQQRSSTETPGAMPARRARPRISPARMKLSCSTNSPRAKAETRACSRPRTKGARSSCFTPGRMAAGAGKSSRGAGVLPGMEPTHGSAAVLEHGHAAFPPLTPTRAVLAGAVAGLAAQVMLIAGIAEIAALSGAGLDLAGWLVGIGCGV